MKIHTAVAYRIIASRHQVRVETIHQPAVDIGLDDMDRRILQTLVEKFDGGPVGVSSLSVAIGEDRTTIEDVYEPFLIKEGFIQRTARGRIAQERAFKFLGKTPTAKQQGLFND